MESSKYPWGSLYLPPSTSWRRGAQFDKKIKEKRMRRETRLYERDTLDIEKQFR
jgi:hypothetical protein